MRNHTTDAINFFGAIVNCRLPVFINLAWQQKKLAVAVYEVTKQISLNNLMAIHIAGAEGE